MKLIEDDLLPSLHDHELSVGNEVTDADLDTDAIAVAESALFRTKMAELEASNHKLRIENIALRNRIDGLKSRQSSEMTLIAAGAIVVWFIFMMSLASRIMAS